MKNLDRMLFTTDFSAASENAAPYALMLARQNKARLYVMHVVDVANNLAGFYVPHMSYEILDKEMEEAAEGMMRKFCAKHFGGYKCEQIVTVGAPYKEIMNAIKGKNINMVVMAASGMGEVGRFFFGSTADRVLRHAPCPVLIIPPANR
ncbi:MAG: universal stress protein [Deltaproteobacteria bacterium]|nr:universal stress protein [Deltaproteobacteria bacterium]